MEKSRQLEEVSQLLMDKEGECAEVNERLQQERDQARRQLKEKERQLGRVNQQL